MTTEIQSIYSVADIVNGKVRTDYSGRMMYGKTCYGIVCDDPWATMNEAELLGLKNAKFDNMGLQYIVYWTSIKGTK